MKILIVVDMQNDFVTGALKNEQAQMIVPNVAVKLKRAAEDCMITLEKEKTIP